MYKVAIVDDEFFLRKSLIETFPWKKLGFEICGEAEDGKMGYDLIKSEMPHIAFVDISMPIMNGIELVEKLRNENNDIEIVILSGYSEFEYAKRCLSLNVNNYLLKPVSDEEIKTELLKIKERLDVKYEGVGADDARQSIIKDIKKYIKDNLQDYNMKIDDIADALGYNYHYLSKLFLEQTNISLGKYIVKVRMEKAKELIEKGNVISRDITEQAGYVDAVYFAKSFKKFYGKTPTQYMQQV